MRTEKLRVAFRNSALMLSLVAMLGMLGCGYRFSGAGNFPPDVRTMYVEPFVNRTREIGIDRELAMAIKSELRRQGRVQIVDQADGADAVLSGVIRQFDSRVVAANRFDEALQYEMSLLVDMTLRKRTPDEILWRTQGVRLTDLYAASRAAVVTSSSDFKMGTLNPSDVSRFTDIQLTETQSREARSRVMEKAARELHHRLMERF
ncbi:MAG: hypothetical protein HY695_13150 [Deltaproteobacteria bacterium]|nr:hypothetical protein [Deltaproteobacteria bacterium]